MLKLEGLDCNVSSCHQLHNMLEALLLDAGAGETEPAQPRVRQARLVQVAAAADQGFGQGPYAVVTGL